MTRAVVLMYHRIGSGALAGREPREEVYAVAPDAFAAQMALLAARGSVVDFETVVSGGLPRHAVALTFDDGNATDATDALAVLARRGLRAAFFVSPARIGRPSFLAWDEVRTLHAAGMTIGAHGLDHTPLVALTDAELARQLRESRTRIADAIGAPPAFMSLPGGAGDPRVLRAAAAAGYRAVATSVQGRGAAGPPRAGLPITVPRFAIRHDHDLAHVAALARHAPLALARRVLRDRLVRVTR